MKALLDLVKAHKGGAGTGICAVCSAHPMVIAAALQENAQRGVPTLIEATSNQVNQFGGYTGMTPVAFRSFVLSIAESLGYASDSSFNAAFKRATGHSPGRYRAGDRS